MHIQSLWIAVGDADAPERATVGASATVRQNPNKLRKLHTSDEEYHEERKMSEDRGIYGRSQQACSSR